MRGIDRFVLTVMDRTNIVNNMSGNILAARLRAIRGKKKALLRSVGAATDIDPALLSRIERGVRLPTPQQTKRLAALYGVSSSVLLATRIAADILKRHGKEKALGKALRLALAHLERGVK